MRFSLETIILVPFVSQSTWRREWLWRGRRQAGGGEEEEEEGKSNMKFDQCIVFYFCPMLMKTGYATFYQTMWHLFSLVLVLFLSSRLTWDICWARDIIINRPVHRFFSLLWHFVCTKNKRARAGRREGKNDELARSLCHGMQVHSRCIWSWHLVWSSAADWLAKFAGLRSYSMMQCVRPCTFVRSRWLLTSLFITADGRVTSAQGKEKEKWKWIKLKRWLSISLWDAMRRSFTEEAVKMMASIASKWKPHVSNNEHKRVRAIVSSGVSVSVKVNSPHKCVGNIVSPIKRIK